MEYGNEYRPVCSRASSKNHPTKGEVSEWHIEFMIVKGVFTVLFLEMSSLSDF